MNFERPRLRAERILTERFALEPLRLADAAELVAVLGDPRLYEHIGGAPPAEAELRQRFARQLSGDAGWLNWVVRSRDVAVGTIQATVAGSGAAELAWVVGSEHQGAGVAGEAALAVVDWLRAHGVESFTAHIAPANVASEAVARRIGLAPTGVVREDGERLWELGPAAAGSAPAG